jgi:hypothetical protein
MGRNAHQAVRLEKGRSSKVSTERLRESQKVATRILEKAPVGPALPLCRSAMATRTPVHNPKPPTNNRTAATPKITSASIKQY